MKSVLLNRRQAMAGIGAGGLTGLAGCRTETKESAETGPGRIDTVVVVMMENRSFDHVFGALKLLEGRDIDGLDPAMINATREGAAIAPGEVVQHCADDPPHGWTSSHDQYNGGLNDGFVREFQDSHPDADPAQAMSYQTRDTMPISYALADAYQIPQRWFCSVMGPTWPNRFYGHAGSSGGLQSNELPDQGLFTFPTVWSKLDGAGVAWKYYYTDLPFIALFDGHFRQDVVLELERFFADAAAGGLPPVCWIDPGFAFNDDHPPHPVGRGQEFIAAVYEALAASPHWENCLLLITYDEHGGFFDHVPPPTTGDDDADLGFDQMGFRVPAVLAGPYVKAGSSTEVFDNTSWLKYICETLGIDPWTARIQAANSIGSLIDTDRVARNEPAAPIILPDFTWAEDGEECDGNGVLGPPAPGGPAPAGHQEELALFISMNAPHLDRRADAARLMAFIRAERRRLRKAPPA